MKDSEDIFFSGKKISIFVPSMAGGGAERVMLNLANEFCEKNISVDLILVDATGPYISEINKKINIVDLKEKRTIKCLLKLSYYLFKKKPEYLISAMDHANIVALIAKKISMSKTKFLVTVHISLKHETNPQFKIKREISFFLIKWLYRSADAVIAVSNGVAEDIEEITGISKNLIHVVYNPVLLPNFASLKIQKISHPWFGPGLDPVIISAGRLTRQKDYATLIRAFAEVLKKMPAKLVILGEGEDRKKLTDLANQLGILENLSLPGFVENPLPYLAHSSVFVLSSAYEGFGNVLVEAMSVGTPVISTDCKSGPSEILENGKYGKLVPVGDYQRLGIEIVNCLNEKMDKYNQKYFLQNRAQFFTLEKSVSQYIEIMKQTS